MITPFYKKNFFTGVNYDFVTALKYEENEIERYDIPINKNGWLIDDLIRMVEDDNYEVDDLYYTFKKRYSDYGDFDYCLGHESLMAFYIDPISYPQFEVSQYRKQAQIYKQRIEAAKNESEKEWRQKSFNKWSYRQKRDYIDRCLPYIFACNYHNAIINNNIEKEYFIFSNETHGRFSYSKKITEDIGIEIKTNFCYGGSSSLVVTISYKGIPILPYSLWVRYYYAGFNEIIRCTRSFSPDRKNWENCMGFVVWFVKKAIKDPEAFVKETILDEVKVLMEGIEEVFHLSDNELKYYMKFDNNKKELQDKYYIGIKSARGASSDEIERYSIAPEEVKFAFRVEKITGALRFIKSLRELREIDCDFEQVINRLKEINELIYPELLNAIPPVRDYIKGLQSKLKPLEKRLDFVRQRWEYYENRLNKKLDKVDFDKRKEVEESFIKFNPQYTKFKNEYYDLLIQTSDLKDRIGNREWYLKKLEDALHLVLIHTNAVIMSKEQNSEEIKK